MNKTALATGVCVALMSGGAMAQDMSCDGLNFVFFPGGPEGGAFASIVYNGAATAAEHLGCDVEYVWSDWNPERMVRQFSEAIARQPDGISIMGHPGEAALGPLIEQAREAGIIVTTSNVDLPNYEAGNKAGGFGYVGATQYEAGQTLGNGAAEYCGLSEGDRALVWGLLGQEGRGQRTRGVVDALETRGIDVEYLEISDAVNSDAAAGTPIFASMMVANPDISMVVTDHGALTATMGVYLRAAGLGPDDVCGAGFDLSAATAQAIEEGATDIVLDQQPFLQGYLPILQLYMTARFGFAGMRVDTGAALITADNIDMVAPLAEAGIR